MIPCKTSNVNHWKQLEMKRKEFLFSGMKMKCYSVICIVSVSAEGFR